MTDNKVLPEAHSSHEGEKKEKQDLVSIREFFKFADIIDLLLMMSGALCAIAVGAALPLFSIIFGGMFDRFNDPTVSPWDVGAEFALQFGYIAIAVFIAASIQVGAFTLSSERQTLRIRVRYLDALLKQDISWFDLQKSGELSAKITENTVLIRDAMGEKLGTLFQFMTMFFAGFAVGFYYSWQLTLVIFAVAPLLGIAGAIMVSAMCDVDSRFFDNNCGVDEVHGRCDWGESRRVCFIWRDCGGGDNNDPYDRKLWDGAEDGGPV